MYNAISSCFNFKLGYTRIARSLFIAKHCDALAIEAYKTAINEIKETTLNITKYTYALDCLNAVLRNQNRPALPVDQEWITDVQNTNKATLDALENELKSAKTSIVKEDIRVNFNLYNTGHIFIFCL